MTLKSRLILIGYAGLAVFWILFVLQRHAEQHVWSLMPFGPLMGFATLMTVRFWWLNCGKPSPD